MGQKTQPIGFRLGINRTWDSRWFGGKSYGDLLHQDIELRKYLFDKLFYLEKYLESYSNIKLLKVEEDFRYIRTAADIIITQSSESTLEWCIGINKPLVFLDSKYYEPLKDEETKKVFKKCFFYFNYDKRGWEKELIKFLNLPITTIMKLWDEKKIYRDEFDEKYFLSKKKNAGKIGSNLILSKKL